MWLEEAQWIQDPDWTWFRHTILRSVKYIFISGNPFLDSDPVYEWSMRRKDLPHAAWIWSDYRQNPHLGEEFMREVWEAKEFDDEEYQHEFLGHPRKSTGELTVLSTDWIEAAIDSYASYAEKLPFWAGERVFGDDPADGGDDHVLGAHSGPFLEHLEILKQPRGQIGKALDRVDDLLINFNGKALYYDDGAVVGSDVSSFFAGKRKPYRISAVPFGGPVRGPDRKFGRHTNKELFRYRNVQMAWNIRQRFRNTWLLTQDQHVNYEKCIFIDPSCVSGENGAPERRKFINQLTQPTWKRGEGDRIIMDKMGNSNKSPDCFDCLCLTYHSDIERGLTATQH